MDVPPRTVHQIEAMEDAQLFEPLSRYQADGIPMQQCYSPATTEPVLV
jgi:hypothetical protein